MTLNLLHLDGSVRALMLEEIESDASSGKLYISTRLSASGAKEYLAFLREAAESHDDTWFANQLSGAGILNPTVDRQTAKGIIATKMPSNAPEMLAEGEFNRFYLRALCIYAVRNGIANLVVYRAKDVSRPRPESEALIGQAISPEKLLKDLRDNIGVDTAMGLPAGPNSGLSARLPE